VVSTVGRRDLTRAWPVASERHGIPVGWAIDGANRNDVRMLEPTLDAVSDAGLLDDMGVLHLDRSYDSPAVRDRLLAMGIDQFEIQRRGTKIPGVKGQPLRLGLRWVVEATDTWWSNYGQLRRNTDRRARHRHAALCLATKQSSSSAASSTGATAATPPDRLSAQALSL
jgi:putative transposase